MCFYVRARIGVVKLGDTIFQNIFQRTQAPIGRVEASVQRIEFTPNRASQLLSLSHRRLIYSGKFFCGGIKGACGIRHGVRFAERIGAGNEKERRHESRRGRKRDEMWRQRKQALKAVIAGQKRKRSA